MLIQNSDILCVIMINQMIYGGGGVDFFYWNLVYGGVMFYGGDINE